MENRAEQRRRAVLEALARATEGGRGNKKTLPQKSAKGFSFIEVSMKIKPLIAVRAKERQKAGGQSGEVGRQKSDKPLDTKKEAAKLAGVSHDTFHKGKVALNHGSTPTPVGSGTPTLGGQDQRTTDGEAHGQGQG